MQNKKSEKRKYKHIIVLIIITILLFCSLSAINAANQTINSTSAGGIAQGIVDTETEGTLTLNPGIYNKTNQGTNIYINKNITIKGNGPADTVIIDTRGLNKIFLINH